MRFWTLLLTVVRRLLAYAPDLLDLVSWDECTETSTQDREASSLVEIGTGYVR